MALTDIRRRDILLNGGDSGYGGYGGGRPRVCFYCLLKSLKTFQILTNDEKKQDPSPATDICKNLGCFII